MRIAAGLWLGASLLQAAVVKDDATPLKTGCYSDSETIGTLASGTPLTLRYALAGEGVPCYKVAAIANGKAVEGYLPRTAIGELDDFDKSREEAAWVDAQKVVSAIRNSAASSSSLRGPLIEQATSLIEGNQPAKALDLLEPQVKGRDDSTLLALAGIAAWKSDHSPKALEYWRQSLELEPNPSLEAMYRRVERETKGDKSGERLLGMRVQLRFEAGGVPVETARGMLGVLDQEFGRISFELGCSAEERVIAVAQSPAAYKQTTNAAEWSGGQFDGKIRVPVFEGSGLDSGLRRRLAHEMAHACISMTGRWPSWVQEGIAQKISGDTVRPAVRARIMELARDRKLPSLARLGNDWSTLDAEQATLTYGLALEAIEMYLQRYSSIGLRGLLANPDRLAAITAELDHQFGL